MSDLLLPRLSIAMEDARISSWLVEDGETVRAGQPVAIVETDKADIEVEANADGVLRHIAAVGDVVPVETAIATIGTAVAAPTTPTAQAAGGITAADLVAGSPPAGSFASIGSAIGSPSAPAARASQTSPADLGQRAFVSPSARRRARELGIDLTQVTGTGPGGRIVSADVEEHATAAPPSAGNGVAPVPTQGRASRGVADLRPAVVAALVNGWSSIPHVNIGGELDAEGLVAARAATAGGPSRVTHTDLLLIALARALTEVPELAATIGPDGAIVRTTRIDLNLAIASPAGVIAPLIADVASLGVADVARERTRLVAAVRGGFVESQDLAHGCCTLSNLGAYPVDFFTPVLSGPQVCLLATGRVAQRVVASNGLIGLRHRMWANVCIDHRAADGEAGARLLRALESQLAQLVPSLSQQGSS